MRWKRLMYFPDNDIKTHFVPDTIESIVSEDIKNRHGCAPSSITEVDDVWIDPGGMMSMASEPVIGICMTDGSVIDKPISDREHLIVSIKPEHILLAGHFWNSSRVVEGATEDGQEIIKVYIGRLTCICLPRKMYDGITTWLHMLSEIGLDVRKKIAEALRGSENIAVWVPEFEEDDQEAEEFEN